MLLDFAYENFVHGRILWEKHVQWIQSLRAWLQKFQSVPSILGALIILLGGVAFGFANEPPNPPNNLSPVDSATTVSLTPTLQASAFSDPDTTDTHQATQWQVRTAASAQDFSQTAFDSDVTTTSLTAIMIPLGYLNKNTNYFWRVRYFGSDDQWSEWSMPTTFTTYNADSLFVPPTGLISWWAGDGNTSDTWGPNHGALVNGATYASRDIGSAFSFDGNDDYFQAPTPGLPTGNANRTLELWVKVDAFFNGNTIFAGYGNYGAYNQVYMLAASPIASGQKILFSQWGESIAGPSLSLQRWSHVAVTNVGNYITLYLNGDSVATGTLTLSTPGASQFYLGRIPVPLGETIKHNGQVDDVRIYNRALSADEIKAIYYSGSPAHTPVNILPAGDESGVSLTPTLHAFAFADPNPASTQRASQWQVRAAAGPADYSAKVFERTATSADLTSVTLPAGVLDFYSFYCWRVRYQGSNYVWTDWSDETGFRTTYVGSATPINLDPEDKTKGVSLTPMLQAPPFYGQNVSETQLAAQWQLREITSPQDFSETIFDSGISSASLNTVTIPDRLLNYNTTYSWRVRYQKNDSLWSPWSKETSFTTSNGDYRRVSFLPISGQIEDVLLDETRHRFWVLRKDISRVEAYDMISGQQLVSIQTGLQPESFAMTYDRHYLGVGSRGNIYLTVVDLTSNPPARLGFFNSGDLQKVFRVVPIGTSDFVFFTRPDSGGVNGGHFNVWRSDTSQVVLFSYGHSGEETIMGLPPSYNSSSTVRGEDRAKGGS